MAQRPSASYDAAIIKRRKELMLDFFNVVARDFYSEIKTRKGAHLDQPPEEFTRYNGNFLELHCPVNKNDIITKPHYIYRILKILDERCISCNESIDDQSGVDKENQPSCEHKKAVISIDLSQDGLEDKIRSAMEEERRIHREFTRNQDKSR